MDKKVCMFVWNHFTNDARVLRECTALSDSGFSVDLICIHDPGDPLLPQYEKYNDSFQVFRVQRFPTTLLVMKQFIQLIKKKKWIGILSALAWLGLVYILPLPTLLLTILFFATFKMKLASFWIKANIYTRMVVKGYSKKYDFYHSNDLNTLLQGYICSKWRINKKKLIYDSHEVQTSRTGYNSPIYGKLEAFLVRKIDSMIVENHTRAKYNQNLYGFYPNVVHNYPFKQVGKAEEIISIHEMLNLPKEEKILLYQGGIQTGRGLDKLIKAVPLFKEGTLVLIGDGKIKQELMKNVEELNLTDKVKFIPKVPLVELPKYTRNAFLGFQVLNNVCFNHFSASSNKLFEYMMNGIPVVACSFPEIQKVVEEEYVGLCVDSHDFHSIAEGVNYLFDHPNEYARMKENTFIAKEKYNWELEKINLLKVYQ